MKIKESTIVQCVGAKAQDWKMSWTMITKTTMGVIFNLRNSYLLTLSIPTEEVFQVHGQNRPVAKLPIVDFALSCEEYHYQSHWARNFRFFFSYIGFLPLLGKFERHRLWTIRIFSVLAAMIRESSDKLPRIENREGFAVHLSTWPSGAKGEWRVSSWLAISNTREKIS